MIMLQETRLQEKYSLKWHTYSDHLRSMMKELMMNEAFADVTLVTEDKKQIKANTNVLSACSPVFSDILKKERYSNKIIYLRGIQFPEMESIMQFIYLGEATFHEERMDEFLAVAKSLEIKELCNAAGPETNKEPDDEPLPSDPVVQQIKEVEEQIVLSNQITKQAPKERRKEFVHIDKKNKCVLCQKTYYNGGTLKNHIRSVHEGVKYPCYQCDYQASEQGTLSRHIEGKHEGVKYACNQCDYQATLQGSLTRHIKSIHEGFKFACDQCDQQFAHRGGLRIHINKIHKV